MRLKGKVVVNLENDDVDFLVRQGLQVTSQKIERLVAVVIEQVNGAPRFSLAVGVTGDC
jgi:hypothetical protein